MQDKKKQTNNMAMGPLGEMKDRLKYCFYDSFFVSVEQTLNKYIYMLVLLTILSD